MTGGYGTARCALTAVLGLILAGPAAAQQAQRYTSVINFEWAGEPPDRLTEEDLREGARTLQPVPSPLHNWQARHSTTSPLSRIYLDYGGQTYLLPYRSYRGAAPVTVVFGRPTYSCIRSSLDQMEAMIGGDVTAQIGAMMAAGNLLRRPASQCPPSSKNRLADLYFRLNCGLAQSRPYVGYLDEAERGYRERWSGDVGRAQFAERCRLNANAALGNAMSGRLNQLAAGEQYEDAIALAMDIQALRRDGRWADAFVSYALTDADVGAWEISRLLSAQVSAQHAGRWGEAQSLNAQLQRLAMEPNQRPAFERAQVLIGRVDSDGRNIRAWLLRESLEPAAAAAQQEQPQ